DGHARPARGDDRRPHPLPRGRTDRPRARELLAAGRPRSPEGGAGAVRRVALKGLAWRKVRGVLTSLAIVLGVAMVSGAFIVTDTMKKARDNLEGSSDAGT